MSLPQIMPEDSVHDEEETARNVFSPLHFCGGKLMSNVFRPSSNTNEISVLRLSYCGETICHAHGKKMTDKKTKLGRNNTYYGYCTLKTIKVRSCAFELDIIASGSKGNKYHAHIETAKVFVTGKPPPMRLQKAMNALLEMASFTKNITK